MWTDRLYDDAMGGVIFQNDKHLDKFSKTKHNLSSSTDKIKLTSNVQNNLHVLS